MASFLIGLLCEPGCESITALEVKELVNKEGVLGKGYIKVGNCTLEEITILCQLSQSASRVLSLIAEGEITTIESLKTIKEKVLEFDFSPFLSPKGKFGVTCKRLGEHPFQAHEIEVVVGEWLYEEKGLKVELRKPDMELFCQVIDDSIVLGVDLTGRDLGKRDYRIFNTRRSLRATTAYCAIRSTGYKGTGEELLINPLMIDGSFLIEAALFANKKSSQYLKDPFSFQKMPFNTNNEKNPKNLIDSTYSNLSEPSKKTKVNKRLMGFAPAVPLLKRVRAVAKLAGVLDYLELTKREVSWLDTKFEKESVDLIVAQPPISGKKTPLKIIEPKQDELFYQARYVLKQNGKMLLVSEKKTELLNPATHHKFKLSEEKEVRMGGRKLKFLTFIKS